MVNKETRRKAHSTNIKFLNTDGITTDNQQLIAETFNNYLTSIAENIKTTDRNVYIQNQNTPDTANVDTASHYKKGMGKLRYTTFQSKPTTTTEIENIIKTLKPKNSYGCDEISTKLLKITTPCISSPLNYICNKVLTKGISPDRLKYSIIKPLYKKGNKKYVSNYRPISLLTFIVCAFRMRNGHLNPQVTCVPCGER
jgi:PHD/YefM family antitoxin component YafN of YafNO toxin-antitoxin module